MTPHQRRKQLDREAEAQFRFYASKEDREESEDSLKDYRCAHGQLLTAECAECDRADLGLPI